MTFAIVAARQIAETRIRAETSVPGDAVDDADPRDTLAPSAWALARTGPGSPSLIVRVVPATDLPRSVFFLDLDAPLTAGATYQLGLAPLARGANGEPTDPTPVELVGKALAAHTGSIPGKPAADLAMPLTAQRGQLGGLASEPALRARLERLARTRSGAFAHAPSWGRGIEAKRTYSTAKLAQEAAALAAALRADPDVKAAEVRTVRDSSHVTRFELYVEPKVEKPFVLSETAFRAGDAA